MSGNIPRDPSWCSYCRHPECYGVESPCSFHKGPDGEKVPYEGRDAYDPSDWVKSVVGFDYKSLGKTWRCVGYDPRQGFWMRESTSGIESNISERAIDKTYHKVRPRV